MKVLKVQFFSYLFFIRKLSTKMKNFLLECDILVLKELIKRKILRLNSN